MDQKDAELLLKISHADSLQELVDLGFQLLGNPIFIDDMYRNVLAYSQDVTIDDPLWQENIVENIAYRPSHCPALRHDSDQLRSSHRQCDDCRSHSPFCSGG